MARGKFKTFREVRDATWKDKELEKGNLKLRIHRSIAVYLTYIIQFFPITPNMISGLAALSVFLAGPFFLTDEPVLFLFGLFMIHFGDQLDHIDGAIARLKNQGSKMLWIFFEDFYHEIPIQFIFLFIGIGGVKYTGNIYYLYFGILALVSQILVMYLSHFRRDIVNRVGVNVMTEDPFVPVQQDNPFVEKDQKLLFKIAVFPMKKINWILFIAVLSSFFIQDAVYYLLYFYGPFLALRCVMFFINTYQGLFKVEINMKKGLIR